MVTVNSPKFSLGQVVATPGAVAVMNECEQSPWDFLSRHSVGAWGSIGKEDKVANDNALVDGSRIFSAYLLNNGEKIWIITDAEDDSGLRASTTILTPDEY